ncbi:MAG TPA: CBS domain-containing protein [Candidatus Limnocylindria bacterium]
MSIQTMSPSVGELMSIDPVVIGADEPAQAAEQLMAERRVSGLPVVDRSGKLVGVVSQTDLVRAHAAGQTLASWPGLAVRHLMTAPALTVRIDESLLEAARRMEERHVHRLVVVSPEGDTPIGVISTLDLVGSLADLLEARDGR